MLLYCIGKSDRAGNLNYILFVGKHSLNKNSLFLIRSSWHLLVINNFSKNNLKKSECIIGIANINGETGNPITFFLKTTKSYHPIATPFHMYLYSTRNLLLIIMILELSQNADNAAKQRASQPASQRNESKIGNRKSIWRS